MKDRCFKFDCPHHEIHTHKFNRTTTPTPTTDANRLLGACTHDFLLPACVKLMRSSNEYMPSVTSMFKTRRFAHGMVIAGLETSEKEAVLTSTLDHDKVQSRYCELCATRETRSIDLGDK